MDLAEYAGAAIRAAREAGGLSQQALAARMSTSLDALASLESGATASTLTTLQQASAALGLDITVLLGSEEQAIWASGAEPAAFQERAETWNIDSLRATLQAAVEVELWTIPPYLCGLYSFRNPTSYAARQVRAVVIEEMLHLQLVSNVLTAIGGHPRVTGSAAPTYPMDPEVYVNLPVDVALAPASPDQFRTFVKIEQPDLTPPKRGPKYDGPRPPYKSIGELYSAIHDGLDALGDDIYVGAPEQQVTAFGTHDIRVYNRTTADAAIDVITSQGEGSNAEYIDLLDDEPSHFLRFSRVLEDYADQLGPEDVYNMAPDPQQARLPPELEALSSFNDSTYSWLLQQIEIGFNGAGARVGQVVGSLMQQVTKPMSVYMMQQPIARDSTETAGPRFAYVSTTQRSLQRQWDSLAPEYRRDLRRVAEALELET